MKPRPCHCWHEVKKIYRRSLEFRQLAAYLAKLSPNQLKGDVEHLRSKLDVTARERDNNCRDLRDQEIANRTIKNDQLMFETKVGQLEREI